MDYILEEIVTWLDISVHQKESRDSNRYHSASFIVVVEAVTAHLHTGGRYKIKQDLTTGLVENVITKNLINSSNPVSVQSKGKKTCMLIHSECVNVYRVAMVVLEIWKQHHITSSVCLCYLLYCARCFSSSVILFSLWRNHLSMAVSRWIWSTLMPPWRAFRIETLNRLSITFIIHHHRHHKVKYSCSMFESLNTTIIPIAYLSWVVNIFSHFLSLIVYPCVWSWMHCLDALDAVSPWSD